MFNVNLISDVTSGGVRTIVVQTCQMVCSSAISVSVEDGIVREVVFQGGCNGNTQGVAALVAGMPVGEAISRLEGISCKGRGTSCPDQLARALKLL